MMTVRSVSQSSSHAATFGRQPGLAAGLGEFTHAQNVALALGDRDHAAGVEQIENVAGLDALVIGRQRQPMALGIVARLAAVIEIFAAGALRHLELLEQHHGVGVFEIVPRVFLLGLQEDIEVRELPWAFSALGVWWGG